MLGLLEGIKRKDMTMIIIGNREVTTFADPIPKLILNSLEKFVKARTDFDRMIWFRRFEMRDLGKKNDVVSVFVSLKHPMFVYSSSNI